MIRRTSSNRDRFKLIRKQRKSSFIKIMFIGFPVIIVINGLLLWGVLELIKYVFWG